jgi:membrane protein DedA with SNARE-associated domain
MDTLWQFVQRHGYGLVFLTVAVEQLGLPVPAFPVLVVMGAAAGMGHYSWWLSLAVAVVAAVLSDLVWFWLGRKKGDSILRLLCRLSLEPASCVRKTTDTLDRYGSPTLLFAKFVPGLSTAAPPLAGSAGFRVTRFLWFDTLGSGLWAGVGLAAGWIFTHQVEWALQWLSDMGGWVLFVLGVPLGAYILMKAWQRRRTLRLLRVPRMTAVELYRLQSDGAAVTVVDLRAPGAIRRAKATLPGAIALSAEELDLHLRSLPRGAHLVFYCS